MTQVKSKIYSKKIVMKNRKAFTLIEIIVTIWILLIVSSSGVFYFFDFLDNNEIKKEINNIHSQIQSLDREILDHNILDYEINFDTISWYLLYSINTNSMQSKYPIHIQNINGTWITLSVQWWEDKDLWSIKSYLGNKRHKTEIKPADQEYTYVFPKSWDYTFQSQVWEYVSNTIKVHNYTENNSLKGENQTILIDINTQSDQNGSHYDSISIVNKAGKKRIFGDGNTPLIEAYLFFEKQWNIHTLYLN